MQPRPKPQLPVYFSTLPHDEATRSRMAQAIVQQHLTADYSRGNNFRIKDTPEGDFARLYERYYKEAQAILGPFTLSPRSSSSCWAYVTNKDHYRQGIHNHLRTSTINAVYYLNVPVTENYRDATISFYDTDRRTELLCYKPHSNDLVIFPDYLNHEPNDCPTEDYRLSINMEIICEEDLWGT